MGDASSCCFVRARIHTAGGWMRWAVEVGGGEAGYRDGEVPGQVPAGLTPLHYSSFGLLGKGLHPTKDNKARVTDACGWETAARGFGKAVAGVQ